ncbi:uncharacterized protein LOC131648723 [Vicia villosa]|uniref:uncharacterized protein LOC131648723 n=1 Tax=Vicia villosa TaxID=3911 RepID=UPI00273C7AE3|nr:uncharacterized protein LOC131648723 [Vicia villosa]
MENGKYQLLGRFLSIGAFIIPPVIIRQHLSLLDLQKAYDMLNWKAISTILLELGFPEVFVNWIMAGVSTVSYRFSINDDPSKLMVAKRGVNPSKCNVYFGAVSEEEKQSILVSTGFNEGQLPFRYLGVPLTSKKMSLNHYLPLIERILSKIHHWSAKLLSLAGRIQLVKSVCTAIASYWMQCFSIPKCVIHKIHSVCRSFIWTGGDTNSRKSPVAWDNVSKPIKYEGMGIINLEMWNQVTMLKLLWNLSKK